MKKLFLFLLLSLSFIGSTYADFQDGLDASQKGDFQTAFKEWTPLAEQGDVEAQYNLGLLYFNGDGVPKDLKQAVSWYKKAAEQGNSDAQVAVAWMYWAGDGVEINLKNHYDWMMKAANQGNACAHWNIGSMYIEATYLNQDVQQAYIWMKKAVDKGCSNAKGDLDKLAVYIANNVEAQYNLGLLYFNGDGVPKDLKQAVSWFTKAAEKGDARAQYYLGNAYVLGEGVSKDLKQGFEWYSKAAEQGIAKAQYNVGLAYYQGQPVTKDLKKAFEWYSKAAEQEHIGAQMFLGLMYLAGEGVNQDDNKAFNLYKKAAEQGEAFAQYALGLMYTEYAAFKDDNKALYWFNKAAEQGHIEAKEELDNLEVSIAKTTTQKMDTSNDSKKISIPENAIRVSDDSWKCTYKYVKRGNGCIKKVKIPANASGSNSSPHGWKCNSGYKKISNNLSEDICEATFLTTNITINEILLINEANLSGQEQYKTTSLENLSCKSYIVVTKGGGINVKQLESSTYQITGKYSQGYTDVTNQRYFELKSKIRQARYELEDVNDNNVTGHNNWTALLAGVLVGVRENQVKDKIRALENQLRNTKMTIRKVNKATYKVTSNTLSFEKTQRFEWMFINCINGEVSIYEVTDKNNSGKINLFQGIHPNDLGNFKSRNERAKNKLQSWSKKPLLSMSDINGNKSRMLTTSTINTDNISIASKIKWFLSTQ